MRRLLYCSSSYMVYLSHASTSLATSQIMVLVICNFDKSSGANTDRYYYYDCQLIMTRLLVSCV